MTSPRLPEAPLALRLGGWALLAALIVAVPVMGTAPFVTDASNVVGFTMAFLGLNMLTNQLGLLSLGQGALMGIGASAALHSVNDLGLPPSLMPIVGLVAGFVVGALIAVPSLRLPGAYLALLTLSLAVAFPIVLRQIDGPLPVLLDAEFVPPTWTGIDPTDEHIWEYLTIVVWAVVALVVVRNVLRSEIGRTFVAARDEPDAAAAFGVAVRRTRLLGVAFAGALAGLGGAMLVIPTPFTSNDQYTSTLSIKMFALAVVARGSRVMGAIPAAAFLVMFPVWLDDRGWVREGELKGLLLSEGFVYAVILLGTAYLSRGNGAGALFDRWFVRRPALDSEPQRRMRADQAS